MKKIAITCFVVFGAFLAYVCFSGRIVGYAVYNQQHGLLKLATKIGAPADREYISAYTPLGLATEFEDIESIRILLSAGASPNNEKFGPSPIRQALYVRKQEVLQELLKGGGDPNTTQPPISRSLLMVAAALGDSAKVRLLLQKGADVFYRDDDGNDAYALVTRAPDELPSDGWYSKPDFRNPEIAEILLKEIERRKKQKTEPNQPLQTMTIAVPVAAEPLCGPAIVMSDR